MRDEQIENICNECISDYGELKDKNIGWFPLACDSCGEFTLVIGMKDIKMFE